MIPFVAVSCVTGTTGETEWKEHIQVGDKVPDFSVIDEESKSVEFPAILEGKPALIVFFATWCPNCQEEMPALNAAWGRLDKEKYDIVLISRGGGTGDQAQSPAIIAE